VDTIKTSGLFAKYDIIQQPAVKRAKFGRAKEGIVILVRRNMFQVMQDSKSDNSIFVRLKTTGSNNIINLACIYIQPSDPDRKLDQVMNSFSTWNEKAINHNVILLQRKDRKL
jgi:hypothetical protein